MSGPEKPPKESGLQRSGNEERPDSDRTNPDMRAPPPVDRTMSLSVPMVPGADERTVIYDVSAATRAGSREYRLSVLSGPKKGAEIPLSETVMTLGRAPDNHIVVPDVSVSRRHVRFTRLAEEGFSVEDLGSGNGTKVNGTAIARAIQVGPGDEISIGDTTVRLIEIGAPVVNPRAVKPSPKTEAPVAAPAHSAEAPTPPPQQRPPIPAATGGLSPAKKKLYGALLAALLVVFGAGSVINKRKAEAEIDAAASAERARKGRLDAAMRLVAENQWQKAATDLAELVEESPDDPDLKARYEKVLANADAQRLVEEARRSLTAGSFAEARASLAKVSTRTVFYEESAAVAREVDLAVARGGEDARKALTEGDRPRAEALVEAVLAVDPQNAAALAVRKELDRRGVPRPAGAPGAMPAVAAPRPVDQASPAGAGDEAPVVIPKGATPLSLYLQGDLANALRLAEQADDALLENLRSFDEAFREGVAKAEENHAAEALESFLRAQKIDREIARNRRSKPAAELGKALGNVHYRLGLDCGGEDELKCAADRFSAAVAADGSEPLYRAALDKTYDKLAGDTFVRAYTLRPHEPDEAKRLFRLICDTLPASHEKHERACRFASEATGR